MRIAVIGGTGRLGGAVTQEAAARGHEAAALGSADVDVTDAASIRAATTGYDAVIAAVKGAERLIPDAARALLDAGVRRLVFVGGAGSLLTPAGERLVDRPDFPPPLRQTSLEQAEALEVFRNSTTDSPDSAGSTDNAGSTDSAAAGVDWTYLSPPPLRLVDGAGTGTYRVEARDTPIAGAAAPGSGEFPVADLAAAIVDILEQGLFIRQRATVGAG